MENKFSDTIVKALSYILVAALSCVVTIVLVLPTMKYYNSYVPLREPEGKVAQGAEKLAELLNVIDTAYIGDADPTVMTDAAAAAMVEASGDRWSYYVSAAEMEEFSTMKENVFGGIGVDIVYQNADEGILIETVEPGGSAQKAGIHPGDIIIEAGGQSLIGMDPSTAVTFIRGEIGTDVIIKVLRDGEELTFTVKRQKVEETVAAGVLLEGNVGYIVIQNFNDRCASETIACIEDLIEQGATKLLFDVRFNRGGYVSEMVDLLDYLLPEGDLFVSEDYTGVKQTDTSNPSCLRMPMAVLINAYTYSSAEFFAAVLEEYEWAFTVGEHTVGKGNYQITIPLSDGSAVSLSVGRYYTPIKGIWLEESGGLAPTIEVEVDEETLAYIYAGLLDPMKDPQVLAALEALK
jgi:carboxyl-terminal processing protease